MIILPKISKIYLKKKARLILNTIQNIFDNIALKILQNPFLLPKRRAILLTALNKSFYFNKDKGFYYTFLRVPNSDLSKIVCYVHPQDVRSEWIHNRFSQIPTRQDYLINISRKIIDFSKASYLLDLGANYGEYLAASYGLCKYIAVEPNPFVHSMLCETAADSKCILAAVVPNNYEKKSISLKINPFYSGGSTIDNNVSNKRKSMGIDIGYHPDFTYTQPTNCIKVETLLKENIDSRKKLYVKIDIEGIDSIISAEFLNSSLINDLCLQIELHRKNLNYFSETFSKLLQESSIVENFIFLPLLNQRNDNVLYQLESSLSKKQFIDLIKSYQLPFSEVINYIENEFKHNYECNYGEIIFLNKSFF